MRRIIGYLGSKINLFDFINESIIQKQNKNEKKLFIDLFAGTCSVSKFINEETKWDIISNDISKYSEILSIQIKLNLISKKEFNKLSEILNILDRVDLIEGDFYNEFSMGGTPKTIKNKDIFNIKKKRILDNGEEEIYYENNQEYKTSRMFFKGSVGKKIDSIKKEIKTMYDNEIISKEMVDLLFLFLLNYVNKNSNYTGVYGAYLKHDKFKKRGEYPFIDKSLLKYIEKLYSEKNNKENKSFRMLSNTLIKHLNISKYKKDDVIIYIDPPYSTRSYESNYHILDYLCDLNFNISEIKIDSKSAMRKKKIKNPFNSKKETLIMFNELIKDSLEKSNHIYISYSSEGLMKEEDIKEMIKELHNVSIKTYKKEYKRYTSGENNGENTGKKNTVYELIWYIKKYKI